GSCRLLAAALGFLRGNQLDSFRDGDRHRILATGQGGVDLAEIDVRPVAAIANGDVAAAIGMFAEILQGCRRAAIAALALGLLFGKHGDGTVEPDREYVLDA